MTDPDYQAEMARIDERRATLQHLEGMIKDKALSEAAVNALELAIRAIVCGDHTRPVQK